MTGEFHYMVKTPNDVPRGIYERHPLVSLDLSQPRVSLYCAESSHKDDAWFVASFTRGPEARWTSSAFYPTDNGYGFWIGQSAMKGLIGDEPIADEVLDPLAPEFRARYALRCGICGLGRVRRADQLNEDLDRLWTAGVFEVGLRGFGAILR